MECRIYRLLKMTVGRWGEVRLVPKGKGDHVSEGLGWLTKCRLDSGAPQKTVFAAAHMDTGLSLGSHRGIVTR